MRRVSESETVDLLRQLGAIQQGHFIGKADGHLSAYVSKEVPTRHPNRLRILAEGIAWSVRSERIEVIVAPPMGALGLGIMVAEELGAEYAYLELVDPSDPDSKLEIKRLPFQEAVRGHRVGIVEDIVTTGQTSRKSIRATQAAGGEVVWLACIWSRSGATAESLGVPAFYPLVDRLLEDFAEEECRARGLCAREVPINLKPGHGADYQALHPDYAGGYV